MDYSKIESSSGDLVSETEEDRQRTIRILRESQSKMSLHDFLSQFDKGEEDNGNAGGSLESGTRFGAPALLLFREINPKGETLELIVISITRTWNCRAG